MWKKRKNINIDDIEDLNAKHINKENPFGNLDDSAKDSSHLKKEGKNSYNEVSFNVLESAANSDTAKSDIEINDYSQRAVISSDEMLKNKNKKKKSSKSKNGKKEKKFVWILIFSLSLIMVLGLVAIFVFLYSDVAYEIPPDNNSPVKLAINEIAECDETLVRLNEFLEDSIDENKIKETKLDTETFEKTKIHLDNLSDKFNDMANKYDKNTEEYLNINYARQAIEARTNMLESGIKIYQNAKDSVETITLTDSFWYSMIDGDNALKESDNLVQSNNADNFHMALDKSREALDLLSKSRDNIAILKTKNIKFDFDNYEKYVGLRLESAIHSVKSCEALVSEDLNTASTENLLYLEKSNQAADIALNIATTPTQTIRINYSISTKPLIEEFKAARKRAAEIDLVLRNYLYSNK